MNAAIYIVYASQCGILNTNLTHLSRVLVGCSSFAIHSSSAFSFILSFMFPFTPRYSRSTFVSANA